MKTLRITTTQNIEVDMSKIQSKKGRSVNEGGSGSSSHKPVTTSDPNEKGKYVHVEPTTEEKKNL